jgi:ribosomal protein L11 methyltransferase
MNKSVEENFVVLEVDMTGNNPDLISQFFFQNGCTGIEELTDARWKVYFPMDFNVEKQQQLIHSLNQSPYNVPKNYLTFFLLESQDWLAEWKSHFKPIKVGKNIWIAPPWEQLNPLADELVIQIDPQMAFGTGHHETTQLMIELMERYLKSTVTVLDAGTGSGILAIIAAKLGASGVFGFDIEPEAIENARHNAELNEVSEIQFEIGDSSVIPSEVYQLILANINRNVLTEILAKLCSHLSSNGYLILSGILNEDKAEIQNQLPTGVKFVKEVKKEEWAGIVLKKENPLR